MNDVVDTKSTTQDLSQNATQYKVRINYRSGHQHTGWFSEFKVEHSGGKVTSVAYRSADSTQFLFVGIDDIESIAQLEHRKVPNKVQG